MVGMLIKGEYPHILIILIPQTPRKVDALDSVVFEAM
jgi:hypothetical protein